MFEGIGCHNQVKHIVYIANPGPALILPYYQGVCIDKTIVTLSLYLHYWLLVHKDRKPFLKGMRDDCFRFVFNGFNI